MKSIKPTVVQTQFGLFEIRLSPNKSEKGYTVTVPKLKDTMAEARKMAVEAIELHCEGLFADGLAEVRVLPRTKILA